MKKSKFIIILFLILMVICSGVSIADVGNFESYDSDNYESSWSGPTLNKYEYNDDWNYGDNNDYDTAQDSEGGGGLIILLMLIPIFYYFINSQFWLFYKKMIYIVGVLGISIIIDIICYCNNVFSYIGVITIIELIAFLLISIVLYFDSRR